MREKGADEQKKQFERLSKMNEGSMTPDLKQWLKARKKILKLLLDAEGEGKQDL